MERQAHTGNTELVKSREMTGRSQTLPWWLRRGGVKTTENQIASSPHLGWVKFCPGLFSSLSASLWKRQMWICASPPPPPPHQSERQKLNNWNNLLACLLLCSTFCPYMLPTLMFTPFLSTISVQRWNSWTAFLVEVLVTISSLLRLRFLSGFPPSFIRSTKCYSSWIESSFLVSRIFLKEL